MKMLSLTFATAIDDVRPDYWSQLSSDSIERKVDSTETYISVSVEFIIIRNNDKLMRVP